MGSVSKYFFVEIEFSNETINFKLIFLNRKSTYKSAKFSITGGRQYSVSLDPAPSIHRGPVPVVLDNWNIHHTKVLILK